MSEKLFKYIVLLVAVLIAGAAVKAGTVTDPHTAVPGATILSSDLNARFSTLYALVNGQLDNANLKVGAAINPTKLDLTKEFPILRPLSADRGVSVGVSGDTQARTAIRGDGSVTFGPGGSTVFDTIFKRTGVGALSVRNAADSDNADLTVGNLNVTGTLSSAGTTIVQQPGCRLTLTSATPVTTSNVTSAATLYITPYASNVMPAYQSSDSKYYNRTFSEISVSLSGITSGTNYDVYARYSSGWAGSLVAWTNDTTRATGLTRSSTSGLLHKTGDEEYLYLGTIRASGSGTCEDSAARRYVWNAYNRVPRHMFASDGGANYTYTTATFREIRAGSTPGTSRCEFVCGLPEDASSWSGSVTATNSSSVIPFYIGISLDADATPDVRGMALNPSGGSQMGASAAVELAPQGGRHFVALMEMSQATGTCTWWTTIGATYLSGSMNM